MNLQFSKIKSRPKLQTFAVSPLALNVKQEQLDIDAK